MYFGELSDLGGFRKTSYIIIEVTVYEFVSCSYFKHTRGLSSDFHFMNKCDMMFHIDT